MKAYTDISFTVEEDLSHWSEEEKNSVTQDIDKAINFVKRDLLEKLSDYEDVITDLNITVTFEDRK